MRREFSQKFSDEVIALNCDNMNKLNVSGGMMVSSYHQIRRIYMKDGSPDYEDHDFNLPGYKIIPSGYMLLEFKDNLPIEYQQSSDNCYHDVHFYIDDTDNDFYKEYSDIVLHEDVASTLNKIIQSVSESSEYNSEKEFVNDSSGRPHFRAPTTGPSLIVLRPQKFQSSNIEAHLHDLPALIQCRRNDKRNCVLLTVDGGPDWSTTSYKNIFCFYKYCRKEDLDILTVTSYAAGFSAYYSIEYLSAPVSRKLTGVKGNPCADGDDVAPTLLPKLTKEKIEKKIESQKN